MFGALKNFNVDSLQKFANGFDYTVKACDGGLPSIKSLDQILKIECKTMIDSIDTGNDILPQLANILRFGIIAAAVQENSSVDDAMNSFLKTAGEEWIVEPN